MNRKEYMRNYQREWISRRREAWLQEHGPCARCKSTVRLEIDHIDPTTKDPKLKGNGVSQLFSWSKDRQDIELAKCQVLCNTCHKEKTFEDRRSVLGHNRYRYEVLGCRCDICREAKRIHNTSRYASEALR